MSLSRDLADLIRKANDRKTSPYDTQATVTRVEDDTLWVHIPNGVDETPIQKTVSANIGDTVMVRVANGRAWIVGNKTAPPTDDTTAVIAREEAAEAATTATSYISDITDAGIMVHPNDNAETGVKVTDKVDIIRDDESVAEFGETVRVGLENGNNVKVVPGGVVINYQGEAAAKFSVNENGYSLINLGEESDSSTGLSVYGNIEGYVNANESLLRIINYRKPTSSGTDSYALYFSDVDRAGKAIALMSAMAVVGSSHHWAYVRAISDQVNGSKVWIEADAVQIDGDTTIDGTLRASTENLDSAISITATTGTVINKYCRRFGNVVHLVLEFRNTSSTASGSDIFVGTLTGVRPAINANGATYSGAHALVGRISATNGNITIRNASSTAITLGSSYSATISFTFIVSS